MTDPVYTVKWTETALKLAEAIPDRRMKLLISRRVDQLANSPEQQGKALVGELAGVRRVTRRTSTR
jgi:mRNA interferase RelE/StbE